MHEPAELLAEAHAFVGAAPHPTRTAPDPVNTAMIRHWCDALQDRNPAYVAPGVEGRGGVVAPPAMLASWTLDASRRHGQGPRHEVLRRLERAGFTAVVATDYEQAYVRDVRPGDVLSEAICVEALSEPKETALGHGVFVTVRHDYTDEHGDLVGIARMRLLKFTPRPSDDRSGVPAGATTTGAPTTPAPTSRPWPRPPVTDDTRFFWEGAAARELRIQRCTACGRLRHPPHPMCGACGSTCWDHVVASGRGRVHSYAVHHHPPLPGIALPHVLVLVDLDEGVRVVSALAEPAEVAIGDAVTVAFTEVDEGLVLPLFRRAAT